MAGESMSTQIESHSTFFELRGKRIEVCMHSFEGARHTILLLHEALGSVSYWREFPVALARATGANTLCYSRPGHGNSEGPIEQRTKGYYLHQTEIVIPALLERFSIEEPILYGHSEGAGIALLYAACFPLKALILESPFVVPERDSYAHIVRMEAEYPGSKLQHSLARYHVDPDTVFYAWSTWAANIPKEEFFPHSILANLDCPVLVLQGADDDFGAIAHRHALQQAIPSAEFEVFANTGHLPHREQTNHVLNRIALFLALAGSPVCDLTATQSPHLTEE
jgi:pimeloyl-ACP methyl ester carboxylesterase